jgi:WD40 repeat protein
VYSLGSILYYLITARTPFDSQILPDLLSRIREQEPVPPRQLNRLVAADLETICLKCLQKKPSDRYGTAEELSADLERFRRREAILARRTSPPERAWRWCRRRPALAALGAVTAVAVIAALAGGVAAWRRAAEVRQVAAQNRAARAERLIVEARHLRESGRVGQRSLALSLVRDARGMNDSPEFLSRLRDEAVACLVVPDIMFEPVNWFGATNNITFRPGAVVFSHDLQVCAMWEGTKIVVRRASDGRELGRWNDHGESSSGESESKLRIGEISSSGRWLALNEEARGRAALWDLRENPPKRAAEMTERCVGFAGFLRDEDFPAFAGIDGSLCVFDLQTGHRHELGFMSWVLRKATSWSPFWRVRRLAVGTGGRLAVASIQDFTAGERPLLTMFDVPGGLLLRRFEMESHAHEMALGASGDLIVAVTAERQTEILDALSGRRLITLNESCVQPGVGTTDQSVGIFWRSNRLVEARLTGARLCREWRHTWEAMNYRYAEGFTVGGIDGLTFSPDGRLLAAAYLPRIGFWDLAANQPVGWYPAAERVRPYFHPVNPSLFLIGTQQISRLNLTTQLPESTLRLERSPTEMRGDVLGEAAFDARGSLLAVAEPVRHRVALLSGGDLTVLGSVGPHTNVFRVALSADGRWLATASRHGDDIRVWNVETAALVRQLPGIASESFAVSADGHWLAVGTAGDYEVQETQTGQHVVTLPVRLSQSTRGRALAFGPDGRWLAVLLGESEVGLVETGTWRVMTTLPARTRSAFNTIAFNRDGTLLAAGGEGGRVCVWDLHAIESELAVLGLGCGQLRPAQHDPLPATNAPALLIHHADFPFPAFPISYPTNAPGVSLPADYNLRRDFSITENPSGAWTYGTKSELAGQFHRFVIPRRDLRDIEGRGDYQNFSWCEEAGREPALRYHPGPSHWVYTVRDPKTGDERTWNFPPAHVYVVPTDGERYRENMWTGVHFTAPLAGTYEFRVKANSFPQFERHRETTRVELLLLHGTDLLETVILRPDEEVRIAKTILLESQAFFECLLHTQPKQDAGQAVVGLDIEVYRSGQSSANSVSR